MATPTGLPAHRRNDYKASPVRRVGNHDQRRQLAIEKQREKRAALIASARSPSVDLAALSASAPDEPYGSPFSPSSDDEPSFSHPTTAVEDGGPVIVMLPDAATTPGRASKPKRRKSPFANQIMYAEEADLADLPRDLLDGTTYVARAPIPRGKRCLAVTAPNASGNTTQVALHSRVSGRTLLRFPSTSLPPSTVLDVILPSDYSTTGLLYVLDILQWHKQNVGSCDVEMRCWWLTSNIPPLPAPPAPSVFTHPTHLVPVPSLPTTALADVLAPASERDGILLYVREASYEAGSTPLALWVPAVKVEDFARSVGLLVPTAGEGEAVINMET